MRNAPSVRHLPPLKSGPAIDLTVNGRPVRAHLGETVAVVLLSQGIRVFSHDADGRPHGLFCGIGNCYECAVTVDGIGNTRACITPVAEGMVIETVARS